MGRQKVKLKRLIKLVILGFIALFGFSKAGLMNFLVIKFQITRNTNNSQINNSPTKNNPMKLVSEQSTDSELVVSVKDFGAVGDGEIDDTSAIQKAVDRVRDGGGGTVFFPNGTYKVSILPGEYHAISIYSNVTLKGNSNAESIIKLAAQQGSYSSILAGEEPSSNLSNFAIYDLAIDGNGLANQMSPEIENKEGEPTINEMNHALRIYIGSGINVENCRFINMNTRNVITVNGNDAPFNVIVSDVLIKDNIFESIGGGEFDHDHSTIYTHGKDIKIINNTFSSRNGAGTNAARTAIEIHGDDHEVKGNQINGFANGIFVTGYAASSDNQVVADNIIENAHTGIMIWSYFSYGNTTNPAISNTTIANNKITLNVDGWRELWGNSPSKGIALETESDSPIKNVNVLNNEISFNNFSGNSREVDKRAFGISFWRISFPDVENVNLRIVDNKINNSLAGGIDLSMFVDQGEISQNSIINPGQSKGIFKAFASGILIDRYVEDIDIKGNSIIDNQTTNTLKVGIMSLASCLVNCYVAENSLEIQSGAEIPIFDSIKEDNNFNVQN